MHKPNILKEYKDNIKRPLVLDGAIGTMLNDLGYSKDVHLWYSHLNITDPDVVTNLHKKYIEAGAEIITTNTFRTNPLAKRKSSLQITNSELVNSSVNLALKAKETSKVIVGGSNAPAEDCYQKERTISKFDLEYNHKKHIELLFSSNCQIIWNETQSHLDEIEIICEFCSKNFIPYGINIFFDDSLCILSGEAVHEVIQIICSYSPQFIGFNCISTNHFIKYLQEYSLPDNFGFYLNSAKSFSPEKEMNRKLTPIEYIETIKAYITNDILFVGSCCGSNPNHTLLIKEHLNEADRN